MKRIGRYLEIKKPINRKPLSTSGTHVRQSRSFPSSNSQIDYILHLQQNFGNREVMRLIKYQTHNTKLTSSKSNCKYEQEANRISDQVMSLPEPKQSPVQQESTCPECKEEGMVQTKPLAHQITPLVQRQTGSGEEEDIQSQQEEKEEPIQAKSNSEEEEDIEARLQRRPGEEEEETIQHKGVSSKTKVVSSTIESRIRSLKGGGQPLAESTRSYFDSRFGTDFSQVHVHTDSRAAKTAKSMNAKAFTTGKDIVFGAGQYSPGTSAGKRLLAHELTHVIQQNSMNPKKHLLQMKPAAPRGQQTSKVQEYSLYYNNPSRLGKILVRHFFATCHGIKIPPKWTPMVKEPPRSKVDRRTGGKVVTLMFGDVIGKRSTFLYVHIRFPSSPANYGLLTQFLETNTGTVQVKWMGRSKVKPPLWPLIPKQRKGGLRTGRTYVLNLIKGALKMDYTWKTGPLRITPK